MTKMNWQHLFFEFLNINNDEIGSLFVPGDNVFVNVILNRKANYL